MFPLMSSHQRLTAATRSPPWNFPSASNYVAFWASGGVTKRPSVSYGVLWLISRRPTRSINPSSLAIKKQRVVLYLNSTATQRMKKRRRSHSEQRVLLFAVGVTSDKTTPESTDWWDLQLKANILSAVNPEPCPLLSATIKMHCSAINISLQKIPINNDHSKATNSVRKHFINPLQSFSIVLCRTLLTPWGFKDLQLKIV